MKNPRTPLTRKLISAWSTVISKRYNTGRNSPDINSEAALQAYFFHELLKLVENEESTLSPNSRTRIFIEPPIVMEDSSVIVPDLVICRRSVAIAVIELKYLPRFKQKDKLHGGFEKDMQSLLALHEVRGQNSGVTIAHDRYRGEFASQTGEQFTFSKNTLLVWGAVYESTEESVLQKWQGFRQATPLLELVAITEICGRAKCKAFFGGSEIGGGV